MFGEGNMYINESADSENGRGEEKGLPNDLFASGGQGDGYELDGSTVGSSSAYSAEDANSRVPVVREVVKYIDKPQRRITEIRIFFDDGTFETFPGR